jgi:hypothetical protein
MPLVIPRKARSARYVRSEEALAEILGHSDFDGEDWAVGDRLIFEDGTEALIVLHPEGTFHVWDDPTTPADLDEVRRLIGRSDVATWDQLFATFQDAAEDSVELQPDQ